MKEENETRPSLRKQGAWLLFAKTVAFAFAFLLPLLVVRFLTQDMVGVYRQAFQVIGNATAILSLGFSMSAYYFLSREREKRAPAIANILLFHFVTGGLACLGLFLYPQILGSIFRSEEMTRLAPEIGIIIWIWIFSTILETVAVANQESILATVFIILSQISKTVLMAGAVVLFQSVDAFLYAAMIQGAAQTLVLLFYLNSRFPQFWRKFSFAFFREHFAYAVPFGLAGILWIMQSDIHNYFVGYRFTEAEYAIYAYGCFQLPLISMLIESVTSVLIPRMSELQMRDDKTEMIRLTARAMQKLAFFFFPIYVFLFITAETFVITLFTRFYIESVPIFLINITLLPFSILITDPIVRAYKELGRFLLVLRIFVVIGMVSALYFGIQHFDLRGMIAIVVVTTLIERFISETVIVRRLGVRAKHVYLLKDVGKTAVVSIIAGLITALVYFNIRDIMWILGERLDHLIFTDPKQTIINFTGGSLTLIATFLVFAPIYLFGMNLWGVIEENEKALVERYWKRLTGRFKSKSPESVKL